MSDSSSESSDDDLLSSPVFAKKRPDRRTERAEKNKLDFFDSCLKGSNARTDVHRRIAEVDNEFREEEEEEEEEENNEEDDNNMEVDGEEHKKENGDGAPATATGEKCGAPISSSSSNDNAKSKSNDNNDGKENVQNQTTSSTKEESSTAAAAAAAPSTAIKSKSSSTTTSSSSTKTSTATKKKTTNTHNNQKSSTNINNEEAYWSKVAAFSLTNSKKTPSCNYGNTSNNIHSARRKLTDAVSGLMDYNSDETVTDDEDGMMTMMMKNGGGRLGMTREQMRSEAEAKSQGGSSSIGLRSMFVPDAASNCNAAAAGEAFGTTTRSTSTAAPTAFATRSQAITQLKSTITTIQREDDDSQHNTPKSLVNPFIALLFQKKKKSRTAQQQRQVYDEEDVWIKLPVIFQNNPILNHTVGIASSKKSTTTVQGGGVMIPTSLIRWMYSCAISSYEVGGSVGTQCCRLLRTFIHNYLAHDDNNVEETADNMNVDGAFLGGDNNNNNNNNNNMSFLHNLTWNDLTSCLIDDFGLWMGEGLPPPLKETDTAEGTTITDQEADKEEKNGGTKKRARKEANDVRTVDVTALKNVCLIWTAMFQQNLIRLRDTTTPNLNADSSNDEQQAKQSTKFVPGDNASQVLAAITRITLDPNFFYSVNTTSSNSSGVILFELLQQMSVSLIKSVSCQFSSSSLPNKQVRREGGSANGGDDATMTDVNDNEASPSSDSAVVAVDIAEQWRKHTAQLMVQSCINLGPGAEGTADNDDVDGQLPLAMAVKKMYSAELNNPFSVEVALMKMNFSEQALWQCLKEEEDEDKEGEVE